MYVRLRPYKITINQLYNAGLMIHEIVLTVLEQGNIIALACPYEYNYGLIFQCMRYGNQTNNNISSSHN